MPTYLVTLTARNPTRKIAQKFAGCKDEEDARVKARAIFHDCHVKSVELAKEKKK